MFLITDENDPGNRAEIATLFELADVIRPWFAAHDHAETMEVIDTLHANVNEGLSIDPQLAYLMVRVDQAYREPTYGWRTDERA